MAGSKLPCRGHMAMSIRANGADGPVAVRSQFRGSLSMEFRVACTDDPVIIDSLLALFAWVDIGHR